MKNTIKYMQPRSRAAGGPGSPLLLAAIFAAATACPAANAPVGYTFTPIAFLGDPAAGGGAFINDFEPSAINVRHHVKKCTASRGFKNQSSLTRAASSTIQRATGNFLPVRTVPELFRCSPGITCLGIAGTDHRS